MAEKKIRNRIYRVEPILAMDALRLKAKLLKVLGGGIDRLPTILAGAGKDKTPEEKDASNAAAVAAFADIFVNGDADEMIGLVREIVELAMFQGDSGQWYGVDVDTYDSHGLNELFEVAVFVLKETFGAFFSELLASGKANRVMEAVSSPMPRQPESRPTSNSFSGVQSSPTHPSTPNGTFVNG